MTNSPILKLLASRHVGAAIIGWLAIEVMAFVFVAHSIGVFFALLLAIATSALGLSDVRRLIDYARKRAFRSWDFGLFGKEEAAHDGATLDGTLQALASLLLILPGFASDFVGLALKSPSVRASVARRLETQGADPRVIDLSPGEWKHEKPKRPPRKRAPRKTSTD